MVKNEREGVIAFDLGVRGIEFLNLQKLPKI